MILKFHKNMAKGLKLKVISFGGLIPTFVEGSGERIVGEAFSGSNANLNSNINILKMIEQNIVFMSTYSEDLSKNFPKICKLIYFPLVVLHLLVFKICGIIGILKFKIFNFSSTEKVRQNQKNSKVI